eukprot:9491289-Pyramimonas_sp.AAC.1
MTSSESDDITTEGDSTTDTEPESTSARTKNWTTGSKKIVAQRERRWKAVASRSVEGAFEQTRDPEVARQIGLREVMCAPENRDILKMAVEKTGIKKDIATECKLIMEEHWTTELGLVLCVQLRMSDRAYQLLIHLLSSSYCQASNKYKRIDLVDGVSAPSLAANASLRKVKALIQDIHLKKGPEMSLDGKG